MLERERERVRDTRENVRNTEGKGKIEGGWVPVIKHHRFPTAIRKGIKGLFTLFLDNIPEEKDKHWLWKTFNYGVVKDDFIPWKRSSKSGNRFGFVRYDYYTSADMAISKLNGIWVENKKLFVKEAFFGQNEGKFKQKVQIYQKKGEQYTIKARNHTIDGRVSTEKENDVGNRHELRPFTNGSHGKCYSQVLNGDTSEQQISLKIEPVGNGWLFRSAVAFMQKVMPLSSLEMSFHKEFQMEAQFRAMGGRSVLITFQSSEIRDSVIIKPWWNLWFETVKPWSGEAASHERFAWLNCQGIPLNAWNASTFKRIGEIWGRFVLVEEDTLKESSFATGKVLITTKVDGIINKWICLEVGGVKFDVKVVEEKSFYSPVTGEIPGLVNNDIQNDSKGTVPALQQEGEGDELDDDDDDMSDIPHGNGGGDLLSNIGKMGVSVGDLGSRQAFSALHSMPGMHKDQEIVEDFESLVEDSVGLGVGLVLCPSNIGAHEQPFDIETQRCEQVQIDKRTDGDHYTEDRSENQLEQTGYVSDSFSHDSGDGTEVPESIDQDENLEIHEEERVSQDPNLNLVVDLNPSSIRKRRRRQLSNLIQIQKDYTRSTSRGECTSSSSGSTIHSNSIVIAEVKDTMKVGGELNVIFIKDDEYLLGKMIEAETQEYLLMTENGRVG